MDSQKTGEDNNNTNNFGLRLEQLEQLDLATSLEPTLEQIEAELAELDNLEKTDQQKYEIWIPKCLTIASCYGFYDYFQKLLEDLLSKQMKTSLPTFIESYIFQLVFQLPVPKRDRKSVRYHLTDSDSV